MCVFCLLSSYTLELEDSITKEFKVFGEKWGDNPLPNGTGGVVSYSFADQNVPGQFAEFDSFITNFQISFSNLW